MFSKDPQAIKIPTRPPGQRLPSFFASLVALDYRGPGGIRLEKAPSQLKGMTHVKLVLPDAYRGRKLQIAVYDAGGRESNRVEVFRYESFRRWEGLEKSDK